MFRDERYSAIARMQKSAYVRVIHTCCHSREGGNPTLRGANLKRYHFWLIHFQRGHGHANGGVNVSWVCYRVGFAI